MTTGRVGGAVSSFTSREASPLCASKAAPTEVGLAPTSPSFLSWRAGGRGLSKQLMLSFGGGLRSLSL